MASVLVSMGSLEGDDQLDFLQKLRAKEMEQLNKENTELRVELRSLRSQLLQVRSLEEQVQRHERQESQLQARADGLQAELEQCERRCEEAQQAAAGLEGQLQGAQAQEAEMERQLRTTEDLRDRLRRAEADMTALNARLAAVSADRDEAKSQLIRCDKVCSELLQEMKDRNIALEQMRQENKELHLSERSRAESHQAQVQQLNAQIQQLRSDDQAQRQQAAELGKAKEVLEERLKSKDLQLQSQELEHQRSRSELEERLRECESRWRKSQEEVVAGQKELQGKVKLEHQLKEKVGILESQVQQHVAEETRLRQDVLRLQTLADERELALEKSQKRQEASGEQASELQKRLVEAQGLLQQERGQLQEVESELKRLREALLQARKEVEEVKQLEEAARRDVIRRSDQRVTEELTHSEQLAAVRARRAEEQVAARESDILRLEEQLALSRAELARRDREMAQLVQEMRSAGSREASLENALEQVERRRAEAESAFQQAQRRLKDLARSDKAVMTSRARTEPFSEPLAGAAQRLRLRGFESQPRPRQRRSASEPLAAQRPRHRRQEFESSTTSDMERTLFLPASPQDRRLRLAEPLTEPPVRLPFWEPAVRGQEPALRPWPAEPVAREDLERAGWPRQREPSVREDPAARTLWPEPAPCDGEEHSPAGRSEEHGGDRREEPAPAASSQEGGIKLQIKLPRREDPPAPAPAAPPKPPPPEAPEAGHLAAAGEEFDGPPRCSEAQLELWRRRLAALEQRELLMEVWHRWFALTRVSTLQSRLELLLTDELRLAKVREEAMSEWAAEFGGYFSQKLWEPEVNFWPEGAAGHAQPDPPMEGFVSKLSALKSFIFEFRQRVAEAVAQLPGASHAAESQQAFQDLMDTLQLGRGAFGRLLHAALFLYQKLRTLVPTELEVTMKDPLSPLIPVPFYVLPYKVPSKVRLAVDAAKGGRHGAPSIGGLARGLARDGRRPSSGRLEELQEMMPLCARDPRAVPQFLAELLAVRSLAGVSGAGYRDGLDQLVADALTVYMSGWRLCSGGSESSAPREARANGSPSVQRQAFPEPMAAFPEPAAAPAFEPLARGGQRARSQGDGPKLRLGPDRMEY